VLDFGETRMQKLAIVLGIPILVALGIVVTEYPEYWWVLLAVPLALVRYLMRRTLTQRSDSLPVKRAAETTDQSHTIEFEKDQ
jgi:glucose-6-phosphate-specific signal transduction histidine kinase